MPVPVTTMHQLCGRYDGDWPCDRPAGHRGGCSGRLSDLERIEREYAWACNEVTKLRAERDAARRSWARSERELAAERRRRKGWRRLLHPRG